ncbi:MAG: spheroidene monooxygenase [Bacteroidota bacterium]
MKAKENQVAAIFFFRFDGFNNRRWAMKQMYEGYRKIKNSDGLMFRKFLGTGGGKGYSLMPDWGTYALLTVWVSEIHASAFKESPLFREYLNHSYEHLVIYLRPVSSRGAWSGFSDWRISAYDNEWPFIAALTRATIKFSYLRKFWSMVPQISREHQAAEGIIFSKGIGAYPFFEQATFTIWESIEHMNHFARRNTHQSAIKVTRERKGFREEMFTRFQPIRFEGNWSGFPFQIAESRTCP